MPESVDQIEYRMTFRGGVALVTFPKIMTATDYAGLERWLRLVIEIGRDCIEAPAANQGGDAPGPLTAPPPAPSPDAGPV